jgi:hypothetical protein
MHVLTLIAPVASQPLLAMTGFFWDSPVFAAEAWKGGMNFLRIFLTLGGALLLMYEWRARRMGQPIAKRTQRIVAVVFTVLAFFAYYDFFNPNVRYRDYYHRHEFFHYYLGSKYNQELSYTRIYECTAIAEIELGRGAEVRKRELRDLRENLIKPNTDTYVVSDPSQCKKYFSPQKWESFKKDVNWFYSTSRGSYWENMQKDHGYNPPPVWTMTGKLFGSLDSAGASDTFFKILSAIDPLLQLGAVLLLWWAFGWKITAIATVFWGCNAPANFYWTGGAFLRQDWYFFLVAALCFTKKRWFVAAGAALMWSALLRIFPAIMFAGWAIVIGMYLWQHRKWHPDHRKLIFGSVLALGLLVPASVITAGGYKPYEDFYMHTLRTLQTTPLTNHMGLETILVHNWDGRMRFTRDDHLDDPFQGWKDGRNDRFKHLKPVFFLIVGGLFLWTAWALRRTKLLWVPIALSLPLTMAMVNTTCYYYCMFIVAAALCAVRPGFAPALLAASGASQILLLRYYFVDDKYTAQSYLFFLLCLIMLYAYSRPFSMERLRAWLARKPEPRAEGEAPTPGFTVG